MHVAEHWFIDPVDLVQKRRWALSQETVSLNAGYIEHGIGSYLMLGWLFRHHLAEVSTWEGGEGEYRYLGRKDSGQGLSRNTNLIEFDPHKRSDLSWYPHKRRETNREKGKEGLVFVEAVYLL